MSSGLVMDEFGEVPDVGEVLLTIPIPSTTTFSSSHTDKYCNIYMTCIIINYCTNKKNIHLSVSFDL